MGVYKSKPVKDKISSNYENDFLKCGASSMQGWRKSQEDAHNCCLDFDQDVSLFAVYDGHGGAEVAEYASRFLPDTIKNCSAYKEGQLEKALIDAFLSFDATLITEPVLEELKKIAGSKDQTNTTSETEEEEEDVGSLREEARMPLADVIARYANGNGPRTPALRRLNGESSKSPYLRAKNAPTPTSGMEGPERMIDRKARERPEGAVLSSAASSSPLNTSSDCEVSSSSGGSSSSGICSSEPLTNGVSEAHSNGEPSSEPTSNGETSGVSTSEEASTVTKKGESCDVVSSSSTVNGESPQSVSSTARLSAKRARTNMYRSLLAAVAADAEDESDSDENDESFSATADTSVPVSSDEEEESGEVEEAGEDEEAGEEESEEEEEEEEEEEDEEEEEEEEETEELGLYQEPGKDSGCTAVVSLVTRSRVIVGNAGDSRAVLCRRGEAVDLSVDHKPEDPRELTRITAAGGRVTPDGRVNGGLNLSRALGDHMYKKTSNLPDTEQMITALPDIKTVELKEGEDEFIVLACDGIWNSMSSQEVVDFIRPLIAKGETLSAICEKLFDNCLAEHTLGDGTGCDNMTCVIVKLFPENSSKRKSEELDSEDPNKRVKVDTETAGDTDTNT